MLLEEKAGELLARLPELEKDLSDPASVQDQKRFKTLSQEHAYLSEIKEIFQTLVKARQDLAEIKDLQKSDIDADFLEVIREEASQLESLIASSSSRLEELLVPPNPLDHANTILEIRAGTGGEEAALFVSDCARMYKLFADRMGWKWELLSCTESDMGGYKEFIMVLLGPNVYRLMQYEAGTHRVQRIPATESQGRVHTSAITIACLVEPEDDDEIKINEKELRIDTYRSSGAGGQHVNTTDSAVRITHLPSGIVVASQEERSQHKNKEKAFRVLKAKLKEFEMKRKKDEISQKRAEQVGSGDRSERIRTYNFPQNRVTDHRIGLTTHDLDRVMEGNLDLLTSTLVKHFHQLKLEEA